MKLKVVVVDLELSRRQKLFAACALVAVLGVAMTSVAVATVKHDFKSGAPIKSAEMNANFEEIDTRLAALEGASHAPVAFSARRSSDLNVGLGATQLIFDQVVYDLGNDYNNTTGRFTAPADGIYLATCATQWTVTGTHQIAAILFVGGVAYSGSDTPLPGASGNFTRPETTDLVSLTAGQTVACTAYHNAGAMQTVRGGTYTSFSVARIY